MELEFIPVEDFYFALTLTVRPLLDLDQPGLAEHVQRQLSQLYGQPSTVAAASQNTYNYVFRVNGVDNSPSQQLILSLADWQNNLRISSDYGWSLDKDRKPIRTARFPERDAFSRQVIAHLQSWLELPVNLMEHLSKNG